MHAQALCPEDNIIMTPLGHSLHIAATVISGKGGLLPELQMSLTVCGWVVCKHTLHAMHILLGQAHRECWKDFVKHEEPKASEALLPFEVLQTHTCAWRPI